MIVKDLTELPYLELLNRLYDKLIVGSLATDQVKIKIELGNAGSIWVTDKTSGDIVRDAVDLKIAAIIVTKDVGPKVLEAANDAMMSIFQASMAAPDIVDELYALGIRITPYG